MESTESRSADEPRRIPYIGAIRDIQRAGAQCADGHRLGADPLRAGPVDVYFTGAGRNVADDGARASQESAGRDIHFAIATITDRERAIIPPSGRVPAYVDGAGPNSGKEAAAADNGLTTFVSILEAVGFSDMMSIIPAGTGLTVFAPSDEAFAALPEGTLDALMADPTGEMMQSILGLHVGLGANPAASIAEMTEVATFGGTPVTVTVGDDGVVLNDVATVTTTDILFDHGVIHIIDTVMTPATE